MGLAALFAACENNENEGPEGPEPREQVGRTVLVYIVGDNGVSELSSLFKVNFSDMKAGMEEVDYSKCNLVVYSEMVNDVPHLISLKQKNGKVVADTLFTYDEQNPLDKEVMASVISQTVSYFPADSYGFVFLSHSSSWVPASNNANSRSIGYYRRTQMNIPDFREALSSAFPKPLKFILFKSYTGVAPVSNENWTGGVATSVIKSAALDNLAAATKTIIPKYIQEKREVDRSDILAYDFNDDANYDFEKLIRNLTGGVDNTDYRSWYTAFEAAVVYRKTTLKNYSGIIHRMFTMEGSEGLSTYIPTGASNSTMNTFYRTLSWYTAAGWDGTGW